MLKSWRVVDSRMIKCCRFESCDIRTMPNYYFLINCYLNTMTVGGLNLALQFQILQFQIQAEVDAMLTLALVLRLIRRRRHRLMVRPCITDYKRIQYRPFQIPMKALPDEDVTFFEKVLNITTKMSSVSIRKLSAN